MSAFVAISRCLASPAGSPDQIAFFCCGCNMPHSIKVGTGPGPRWGYNGNPDAPTFTPSVLARTTRAPGGRDVMTDEEEIEHDAIYASGGFEAVMRSRFGLVCHSFITAGRVQYLGDCTHHLAGQTVDLPDWDRAMSAWGET